MQADIEYYLASHFKSLSNIPVIYTTATEGRNLSNILHKALEIRQLLKIKFSTGKLNAWLQSAIAKHSPPLNSAGRRLKFKYITQVGIQPPTFRIFTNVSDIPGHYSRYLENDLKANFELTGIPIRLQFKTGANPFAP